MNTGTGGSMLGNLSKIVLSINIALCLSAVAVLQIPGSEPQQAEEWEIHTVELGGLVGRGTSIALDSKDTPHICYRDFYNNDLKYAKWTGSGWSTETVHSGGIASDFFSIAIDSNDNPHIGFGHAVGGGGWSLKYAKWDGTAWSEEDVDTSHDVGLYPSLALDGNDYAHIGYQDQDNYDVKYARWTGIAWNIQIVESSGTVGWVGSLALDSNGHPRISYFQYDKGDLKLAKWTGSTWNTETVDSYGRVGMESYLALDSFGNPHISYFDITNRTLKLARWTGSAWHIETVDDLDGVGRHNSIAIDGSDYPHIGYWDRINNDLKYAEWTGSEWNIETVDSYGLVGNHTSIAIDSNDHPHISYGNRTGHPDHWDLKYATKAEIEPPPQPVLSYAPSTLYFGNMAQGQTKSKTFEVWNSGTGTLIYEMTESIPWVTDVNPPNGSSTGERDSITVSVDTTGLSPGNYTGSIEISSNGGNGAVDVYVNVVAPVRSLSLDIDPDTLNLKSKGRWTTVYLTTDGADARDIDPSSLLLDGVIGPERWDIQDHNVLMLKFDRAAVQAILSVGDSVDIGVTGQWTDGGSFELSYSTQMISPGR